jgi:acyl dehydratase
MKRIRKLFYEEIELGSSFVTVARTITEADIVNFACLTGDFNPLHMDDTYAKDGLFGQRIAHGLLGLSVAAGQQTDALEYEIQAFMNLNWTFKRPIFIGDTVYVESTVSEKKPSRQPGSGVIVLSRKLINQHGKVTQEGTFQLLVAGQPKKDAK